MTVANPAPLDRPATGRPRFPTDADGLLVTPHRPPDGGPAWALAFEGLDPLDWPDQGEWEVEDYLRLDPRGVELVDGGLRWKAMADEDHDDILFYFATLLRELLHPTGRGRVNFANFMLKTVGRTKRQPDVVVMLAANPEYATRGTGSWRTADFVVEVVSDSDAENDYVTKRREYAAAGVREYWIVDRYRREILTLVLDGGSYREAGTRSAGEVRSDTIPDFAVNVADVWAAAGL